MSNILYNIPIIYFYIIRIYAYAYMILIYIPIYILYNEIYFVFLLSDSCKLSTTSCIAARQ